ncbi:MAG: hypothetical protein D6776_02340 [Planctomycetota bacterium]|nr:MAG: hypothetical protein D6776_02340 [Planctomycetota bacterium]
MRVDAGSPPEMPEPLEPDAGEEALLEEAADGADGELALSRGTGAPGALETPQRPEAGLSASVGEAGLDAQATDSRGRSASVSSAGGSIELGVARAGDGESSSGSIGFIPGWVSLALSRERPEADGGLRSRSVTVAGWSDSAYLGVGESRAHNGITTRRSGGGAGLLDREVRDLGPYAGADPALQGRRRVELHRSRGLTLLGSTGRLLGETVGAGVRLSGSRGDEVIYRTHLAPEQADAVLYGERGAARFVADKLRALGVKSEPLEPPPIDDPDVLQVGDELIVRTSGSVTGGLGVGALGAGVGAHVTVRGDLELAARRIDAHHVQLSIEPVSVRGVDAEIGLPGLLEADAEALEALGLRQSFVFDLRQPAAREAYARMIEGRLPGAFVGARRGEPDAAAAGAGASELAGAVRDEVLPPGVERVAVQRTEAWRRRVGGGLRWGPIDRLWGFAALGADRLRTGSDTVVTDGRRTLEVLDRGIESRRQVLLSGEESLGVRGAVRTRTAIADDGSATRRLDALALEAVFADSRVRGRELNDEVIEQINRRFGTAIEPFSLPVQGREEREVRLARTLGAGDLARIAAADEGRIELAAERSEIDREEIVQLVRTLGESEDPIARAERVRDWVADRGLAAMAAVCALAGDEPPRVETTSSQYTAPLETLEKLAFRYREPIAADASNEALCERWEAVETLLEAIGRGRARAADDPLLDDARRREIDEALAQAAERARALLSVAHLAPAERRAMYERLDAGWTTAREYRIMAQLEAAGLESNP